MTPRKTKTLVVRLGLILLAMFTNHHQQVSALFNTSQYNPLECYEESGITEIGAKCRPLEVYNQLEWSRMSRNDSIELAKYCSCKLVNLDWESVFDDHPSTRRVFHMVKEVLAMDKYKHDNYPPQLWSDIDVVVNGYSIYLSTKEYFRRRRNDSSVAFFKDIDYERQAHLRDIRTVCFKVAKDKSHYFQYLENLQRIDPFIFFSVLKLNDMIDLIYQASKACKLLILHRLDEFKKRPDNRGFYAADQASLTPDDVEDFNQIQSNNDIDLTLKDLSLRLFNCKRWHSEEISLNTLEADCPMMMNDSIPASWFEEHLDPSERSLIALKCGCELLALNSTWVPIINDKNLDVMSKALTKYMVENKLPVLNDRENSVWEYFAWFERVMDKFIKNKKMSVKEIIKYRRGQDPANEINRLTGDEEDALGLLRLGCNRLIFNHIKGSTASDAVRPIKYLDNLRYISQDPQFVFHLTLLDPNLFKLHALSKMCEPVVH